MESSAVPVIEMLSPIPSPAGNVPAVFGIFQARLEVGVMSYSHVTQTPDRMIPYEYR